MTLLSPDPHRPPPTERECDVTLVLRISTFDRPERAVARITRTVLRLLHYGGLRCVVYGPDGSHTFDWRADDGEHKGHTEAVVENPGHDLPADVRSALWPADDPTDGSGA